MPRRVDSNPKIGEDIANSIPDASEEDQEELRKHGHGWAMWKSAGSDIAALDNLAEIGKIAKKYNQECDNISQLFEDIPHIPEEEIEALSEGLIDGKIE